MPEKRAARIPRLRPGSTRCSFDQAAYAPDREQLIKRRISDSELGTSTRRRAQSASITDRAEIEQLDIYRSRRAVAPVFVFVRDYHWPCDYGFPVDVMARGISVRLGA
jgi:hypothetical protein